MGNAMVIRLSLPPDIAAVLVRDGDAVRPFPTRGSTVGEVARLAIEGVNTGADIVTLVVAVATCRKIAKRLQAKFRDIDNEVSDMLTITATTAGETQRLTVSRQDPIAEDKILDFLISTLPSK